MNFMKCTTCSALVNINATGICMACQMQNGGIPQEDTYTAKNVQNTAILSELLAKKQEIEDALQKSESKSLDACQPTEDGEKMGKGNAKRRKTPKKKGKSQEKE